MNIEGPDRRRTHKRVYGKFNYLNYHILLWNEMMMMMMLFATGHKTLANVATESISPSLLVKSAKQNGRTIVFFVVRSQCVTDRAFTFALLHSGTTCTCWCQSPCIKSSASRQQRRRWRLRPTDRQRSKTERCQTNLEQRNKTSLLFAISLK